MGASTLFLILFNVGTLLFTLYIYFRVFIKPREDVRLSRGLQLLQSKIAVLEDLKDRTEHQSHQISHLLEVKIREIKNVMVDAEKLIERITGSQQKSLEVAQIFEEKIPHHEVIERQNSKKYILAMQMYHAGKMPDEISEKTGLSRAEINLVIKVRTANESQEMAQPSTVLEPIAAPQPVAPSTPINLQSLSQLGQEFRAAIETNASSAQQAATSSKTTVSTNLDNAFSAASRVRKVEFPKIEINHNLN